VGKKNQTNFECYGNKGSSLGQVCCKESNLIQVCCKDKNREIQDNSSQGLNNINNEKCCNTTPNMINGCCQKENQIIENCCQGKNKFNEGCCLDNNNEDECCSGEDCEGCCSGGDCCDEEEEIN